MSSNRSFVLCENLVKIYKVADLEVVALQGLDLTVEQGEMVALVGASGSGKSTLLHILAGLALPSAGQATVGRYQLLDLNRQEQVDYRQKMTGFVWQQPGRNLLPYLTALENIMLPMQGRPAAAKKSRAYELLEQVNMAPQTNLRPDQLSGGQQQRVALAIALANQPQLLLADEPTGQLDSDNATAIFERLQHLNQTLGTTVILVTHDPTVSHWVHRVISIRDGRTSTELRRSQSNSDDGPEEWVILDRSGRLQIPSVYVSALGLQKRVKIRHETDHLSVWPAAADDPDALNYNNPFESPGVAGAADQAEWQTTIRRDSPPAGQPAFIIRDLTRDFIGEAETVRAVDRVSLTIPAGSVTLIKGRSGSGKTTLLNLLAALDEPTSGKISFFGQDFASLSPKAALDLRRRRLGMVFQTFGLLPFLTVRENVEVPLRLLEIPYQQRRSEATTLLDIVGLLERGSHRTNELSGGEQQRVGIARALAAYPWVILADEPTGQLDTVTGTQIIGLFRQMVDQFGVTVVIASHDPKVEAAADQTLYLVDGRLEDSTQSPILNIP